MERIAKDNSLQANEASNLRPSHNPLLDDLLEAQEREVETKAEARRMKKEVTDRLKTMEKEYNRKGPITDQMMNMNR